MAKKQKLTNTKHSNFPNIDGFTTISDGVYKAQKDNSARNAGFRKLSKNSLAEEADIIRIFIGNLYNSKRKNHSIYAASRSIVHMSGSAPSPYLKDTA